MADDFGKKLTDFGKSVWEKAQDTVDIVGMNSDIASKNCQLTDLYAQIGKAFCVKNPDMARQEFPDLTEKALELAREITALEEKVLLKKGNRKCPSCGAMAPAAAAFCPSCGGAMPVVEEAPEPEPEKKPPRFCKGCGGLLEENDVFCPACGAKQE